MTGGWPRRLSGWLATSKLGLIAMALVVGAAAGLLIGGLAVLAGVGRPAARTDGDVAFAEAGEPLEGPAEIERYLDGWRTKNAPAITATPENEPTTVQRVVGRAIVVREDEA